MPSVLVTVKLCGQWRVPEVDRELERGPLAAPLTEDATVLDLLRHLATRFGPRFQSKVLRTNGEARPDVKVFVNDEQVDPASKVLVHTDRPAEVSLVLLAPMAGG